MGLADLSPIEREWVWTAINGASKECQFCGEEINVLYGTGPDAHRGLEGGIEMECDYCGADLLDLTEEEYVTAFAVYSKGKHKAIAKEIREELDNIMSDEQIDKVHLKLDELEHLIEGTDPDPNDNKDSSSKSQIR